MKGYVLFIQAEIEFIDYGTREVVNVMALREIPEQLNELRTHPAQVNVSTHLKYANLLA